MNFEMDFSTVIKIKSTYDNLIELAKIENLYSYILNMIFLNKAALIVTIEPQKKSSLGYEIGSFRELKIDRNEFLITEINSCSSSMLSEVSQSEEFTRGLLILISSDKILSENTEDIIKHIHNGLGFEDLSYEIVYCENDGRSLCLSNTKLSKEDLISVVTAFENNHLLH
jgi:hypothetical protein